jgi:heat shock protein HslJ
LRSILVPLPLVLVLALAAGCGGEDGGASEPASLEGVAWVVRSGIDVEGWESVAPNATFAEGTVSGSTGCNTYMGPYTVDGDTLELGALATTRMACAPPADAVEREYVAALEQVAGWRIEDGELVLADGDGAELLRYGVGSSPEG